MKELTKTIVVLMRHNESWIYEHDYYESNFQVSTTEK